MKEKRSDRWQQWASSAVVAVLFLDIRFVTDAKKPNLELLVPYWWIGLGLVLFVVMSSTARRFDLWRFATEPVEKWRKPLFVGILAFLPSYLFYLLLQQQNKEPWIEIAVLFLVASVALDKRVVSRFGWIGVGALLYLPFIVLSTDFAQGPQWNFWRLLVTAFGLLLVGILGPIGGGQAGGVAIGCWIVGYGGWWLWKRFILGVGRQANGPPPQAS